MAYKCLECGHIFEEGEEARWSEERGEFWGTSCSEEMIGCPLCKGEYEETAQCAVCGSHHLENELNCGVCDECIDEYKYDIDMCFAIGSQDADTIELNCFLASIYSREEIEHILFETLKEKQKYMKEFVQKDCEKFVEDNRSWFAETLVEEVKKNENAKG